MSDKYIKTPIQQLLKLIYNIGANEEYVLKEDIVSWLSCFGMNEEKEFAMYCFEAGMKHMTYLALFPESENKSTFENFYKKYEQ